MLNSGTITSDTSISSTLYSIGTIGSFTNTGTISAPGAGAGAWLKNITSGINAAAGQITSADGYGLGFGSSDNSTVDLFTNAGTISSASNDALEAAITVGRNDTSAATVKSFVNTGTITSTNQIGIRIRDTSKFALNNTGTISGGTYGIYVADGGQLTSFAGTGTVNGTTAGMYIGAGNDAVVTLSGNAKVDGGIDQNGGTLTIGSHTLTVKDTTDIANGATVAVTIGTSTGQITNSNVDAGITVNNGAIINITAGGAIPGQAYTIVDATGAVGGANLTVNKDNIVLNENSSRLNFELTKVNDTLTVTPSIAQTSTSPEIDNVVDAAFVNDVEMSSAINNLTDITSLNSAMSSLSNRNTVSSTKSTASAMERSVRRTVKRRPGNIFYRLAESATTSKSGKKEGVVIDNRRNRKEYGGPSSSPSDKSKKPSKFNWFRKPKSFGDTASLTGIWAKGIHGYTNQKDKGDKPGSSSKMWGTSIGYDKAIDFEAYNALMGIAYTKSWADVDPNHSNNDSKIDAHHFSVYGNLMKNTWALGLDFMYGRSFIDSKRYLSVGPINRTATADYDSHSYSADASISKNIIYEKSLLVPSFGLTYMGTYTPKFKESGAGSANLITESSTTNEVTATVGLTCSTSFQKGDWDIFPNLNVGFSFDLMDDDIISTSSFQDGGPTFSSQGLKPERYMATLGTDVTIANAYGVSFIVNYGFSYNESYYGHNASVKFKYEF